MDRVMAAAGKQASLWSGLQLGYETTPVALNTMEMWQLEGEKDGEVSLSYDLG